MVTSLNKHNLKIEFVITDNFFINFPQTEQSLSELQRSIHPTYTEKMMSVIQNHKDMVGKAQEEL